ncbi:MAG: hypothetical protein AB7F40_12200 [Victivallaceae bacterium]|nr:hypothetical protein [Victivallaceae bacterium]
MRNNVEVVLPEPICDGQESDGSFTEIPHYPVMLFSGGAFVSGAQTISGAVLVPGGEADTMSVFSGGIATGTTIMAGGTAAVASGGLMRDIAVKYGASLSVAGTGLAGVIEVAGTLSAAAVQNCAITLRLDERTPNDDYVVSSYLYGSNTLTLVVSDSQIYGLYKLVRVAAGVDYKITLRDTSGSYLGSLDSAGYFIADNTVYWLEKKGDMLFGMQDNPAVYLYKNGELVTRRQLVSGASISDYVGYDKAVVDSGGEMVSCAVMDGGEVLLNNGALVSVMTVRTWGALSLNSGSIASALTVNGGVAGVGSGGVVDGMVVSGGGVVTVESGGSICHVQVRTDGVCSALAGSVVEGLAVERRGSCRLDGGVTLTGTVSLTDVLTVNGMVEASGADICINVRTPSTGGSITRMDYIHEAGSYAVTITGYTTDFSYILASAGAEGFDREITVVDSGGVRGSVGVDSPLIIGADTYTLTVSASGALVFGKTHTIQAVRVYDRNGILVYDAPVVSGYDLSTGGMMIVDSGGLAVNTQIMSGSEQLVKYGGRASGAVISGAQQYVDGGAVSYVTVGSGGIQWVGGNALSTVVSAGGVQMVYSWGRVDDVVVGSGGRINIASGASILNGRLESGAIIGYDFNVDAELTRAGGEFELVSSMSCDFEIGSGVQQVVLRDYLSLRADIVAGGEMIVSSGGTAVAAQVSSGGGIIVGSGGTVSAAQVFSGGEMVVLGGLIYDTGVAAGGSVRLGSDAAAYGTFIAFGNYSDLPQLYVEHGAAIYSTLTSGRVSLSGASYQAVVEDGNFIVNSDGEAYATTVNHDGTLTANGGVTFNTQLCGGFMYCHNMDYRTVIIEGLQIVESDAVVYGTKIYDGGQELSGISYDTMLLAPGGWQQVTGRAVGTVIEYGVQHVGTTGIAEGTVVLRNGEQRVDQSAAAYYAEVSGGLQDVFNSGSAFGTGIYASGLQLVRSDGMAFGTVIHSFGIQQVESGGLSENTVISSGGRQVVGGDGRAAATVVTSGGVLAVSGGVAEDTLIMAGGVAAVYSGEIAGTISVFGTLAVRAQGAVASGSTLQLELAGQYSDEKPMVVGSDLISGVNWRADVVSAGSYYLASDASNLWSGADGGLVVCRNGESIGTLWEGLPVISVDGTTYMLRNDADDLVLFVYSTAKTVTGEISGGNAELSIRGANISQLVTGASQNVTGDVSVSLELVLENTCNIYGGGCNVSVGGTISLYAGPGGSSLGANRYTGTIYGGSRAYSGDVSTGDINMTVSNIIHVDNVRMLKYGQTAWLVGGGCAYDGVLAAGDVTVSVTGGILTNVIGGAQAQGAGSVGTVASTSITISNTVIIGDVYGGGYAYDSATSVVTGDVAVVLDSVIYTTAGRSIYAGGANPSYTSLGGSSVVNGNASITFRGVLDAVLSVVSGDGKVAGTVLGTKSLHFDDCVGTIDATIQNFDEIAFAGNSEISHSGVAEALTFMFDVSGRDDSQAAFASGFSFGDGDSLLKVELGDTEGGFDLMKWLGGETVTPELQVELYREGVLYGTFDAGGEYEGYGVTINNRGNLALTWHSEPW